MTLGSLTNGRINLWPHPLHQPPSQKKNSRLTTTAHLHNGQISKNLKFAHRSAVCMVLCPFGSSKAIEFASMTSQLDKIFQINLNHNSILIDHNWFETNYPYEWKSKPRGKKDLLLTSTCPKDWNGAWMQRKPHLMVKRCLVWMTYARPAIQIDVLGKCCCMRTKKGKEWLGGLGYRMWCQTGHLVWVSEVQVIIAVACSAYTIQKLTFHDPIYW